MTKSENETRGQRILDAASELFIHYGYDKTTVNDIAHQAGVSKGAIYLHFQSKDDLLEALIIHEMQAYADQWLALMEADPQGGTIAALYKNSLYALSGSPFMSAMFRQDGHILGNYLRKPDNFFKAMRDNQEYSDRYLFVKMGQEAGVVRQDIDAKVIAHVMNMLALGLINMKGIVPEADIPPIEETIEGIAAIMDSALTPTGGGSSQAGKEVVRQIVAATRQQFESMKNPTQE